jgi:uroporphyrinogen decarboxylase
MADLPNYCYIPNLRIVEFCKDKKYLQFVSPKGIGENYKKFNNIVKPEGINIDYDIDPLWAKQQLKNVICKVG